MSQLWEGATRAFPVIPTTDYEAFNTDGTGDKRLNGEENISVWQNSQGSLSYVFLQNVFGSNHFVTVILWHLLLQTSYSHRHAAQTHFCPTQTDLYCQWLICNELTAHNIAIHRLKTRYPIALYTQYVTHWWVIKSVNNLLSLLDAHWAIQPDVCVPVRVIYTYMII